jgi:triosephosphate isomerase (TIM)
MHPGRTPLIVGNWKMHKTVSEAEAFIDDLLPRMQATGAMVVVICPAYLALRPAVDRTRGSRVKVFAQNMHYAAEGPFTGEVSAPMLVEAGVTGVILGHSERRRLFAESDRAVQLKTAAAVAAGMVPIVCVRETEEECELRETEARIREQVWTALALVDTSRLGEVVIAYEPSWTIGTGRVATPAHVQDVGSLVRGVVADRSAEQAMRTRVLYGGGILLEDARELLEIDNVDGLLVGEASLEVDSFAAIVHTACGSETRRRPSARSDPARTASTNVKQPRLRSRARRSRLS